MKNVTLLLMVVVAACTSAAPATDAEISQTDDADVEPGAPDAASDTGDGTPTRQQCTTHYGTALNGSFGRIDGVLVAIVPLGSRSCNGDSTHVHLQVKMNGAIYDVAVNADGNFDEGDLPIPDGAWSEGWHDNVTLDYPSLGIHSTAFTDLGLDATAQKITDELAQVNHISVFMQPYTGSDAGTGGDFVHRYGSGHDGAIVLQPLSGTAHLLFFDFSTSGTF